MSEEGKEGRYHAEISDHSLARSSGNHTRSVKLQVRLLTNYDDETPAEGYYYHDLWLSEKAKPYSFDTLRKIFEWDCIDLKELNDSGILIGRPCVVVLKNVTHEGKTRLKIVFLGKQFGMSREDSEELELDDELEELNQDLAGYRAENGMSDSEVPEL